MAPHASIHLSARDASDNDSTSSPIIIAGIIVAAVLGVGAGVWFAFRWYRKRAAAKREGQRGAAFAHFQGADEFDEKGSLERCVPRAFLVRTRAPWNTEEASGGAAPRRGILWATLPHGRRFRPPDAQS